MITQDPEVSVIIPSYNAARYIETAVISVLSQTGPAPEIIVVDDGSTDGTENVLKDYVNRELVTYIRQDNRGQAGARNVGIKNSKGQFICFLDADDTLDANSVQTRLSVFKRYPELGLVFTDNRKVIRKDGKDVIYRENDLLETSFTQCLANGCIRAVDGEIYLFGKDIFYELILRCFIWTGTVMTRRHVLSDVGYFSEEMGTADDHDLWLRIARKYEIGFLAYSTATYLMHDGSITKNIPKYFDSSIKVSLQYLDPAYGLPEQHKKRVKKKVGLDFFSKGYYYFEQESYSQARREFRQALNYDRSRAGYYLYFTMTLLPDAAVRSIRTSKNRLSGLLKRSQEQRTTDR